jgi:hypothetical protein
MGGWFEGEGNGRLPGVETACYVCVVDERD